MIRHSQHKIHRNNEINRYNETFQLRPPFICSISNDPTVLHFREYRYFETRAC